MTTINKETTMTTKESTLTKGTIVVIRKSWFKAEYRDKDRRFESNGCGFGVHPGATGKVFGKFLIDDEECYIHRGDIDWAETAALTQVTE